MRPRAKSSTTRLPQALREEIYGQPESSFQAVKSQRRKSSSLSRKAERKAERDVSKQRRAHFFSSKPGQASSRKLEDLHAVPVPKPAKRPRLEPSREVTSLKPSPKSNLAEGRSSTSKSYQAKIKPQAVKKPKPALSEWPTPSTRSRSQREDDEDAYAALLEKKLGLDRSKKGKSKYGTAFESDGLLDLLEDLDENILVDDESQYDEPSTYDDDTEDESGSNPDSETSIASEESVHPGVESDEDLGRSGGDDDEWTGFSRDEAEYETPTSRRETSESLGESAEHPLHPSENHYIPPHLRKTIDSESNIDKRLAKAMKGLLNRLSEQNIDSILKETENLYRSYRRHDVSATLTKLIIEGTCSHSTLLDSYVALHAGLIACLHKIIGIELAATFVQTVVATFQKHYQETRASVRDAAAAASLPEDLGKECSNLLVLLSDLYNYHVISCVLMYDVVRLILDGELTEIDVELVLKLVRSCGQQLRQDDPSALKDIIQVVQAKVASQGNTSSRTRFMVETLNNLKNNKVKKGPASAQGNDRSKDRISKFVNGMGKRYHVLAHEPLRVSLEDLNKADEKGKWWLVGAAWGGDPLAERQADAAASKEKTVENDLLKLARKQGMNTDVRRSVFVMLMSSDDYVDACDRIAQLNLTEVQQREVVRVLLHCCGNERSYNPYYALIGSHLCNQSHSHKVTLQFCFWDFLRSLGESNVGGAELSGSLEDMEDGFDLDRVSSARLANIARIYAWWIAKENLSATILKTLDFLSLKAKTRTFLRQLFVNLFVFTQSQSPIPNFSPTILARRDEQPLSNIFARTKHLPSLVQGLLVFLSLVFKDIDEEGEDMRAFLTWACGVARTVLEGDGSAF